MRSRAGSVAALVEEVMGMVTLVGTQTIVPVIRSVVVSWIQTW